MTLERCEPRARRMAISWVRNAAEKAMTQWLRIKADMSVGAYAMFEASASLPDPIWPDYAFKQLLQIGFRDRLVDSVDHPVIRRLRGES